MRVPSLKAGTHTLKLTVDTKTSFGVLKAERKVIIEDAAVVRLQNDYLWALAKGSTARAVAISKRLIARRFTRTIKPGRPIPIDKSGAINPSSGKKPIAGATWYPEKDALRVVVTVADPDYPALVKKGAQTGLAYVALFICPTGADRDICVFYMTCGKDAIEGAARIGVKGAMTTFAKDKSIIGTTWKVTPKGYIAEVTIPWSILKGLPANWAALPVEAMVTDGRGIILTMSDTQDPTTSAYGYSLLTRK